MQCLELLRYKYGFAGYIHAKIIPGVSPEILHRIGLVADRLSVNIEMPSRDSLQRFAPQTRMPQILAPMRQITNTLIETRSLKGPGNHVQGAEAEHAGALSGKEAFWQGEGGEPDEQEARPQAGGAGPLTAANVPFRRFSYGSICGCGLGARVCPQSGTRREPAQGSPAARNPTAGKGPSRRRGRRPR